MIKYFFLLIGIWFIFSCSEGIPLSHLLTLRGRKPDFSYRYPEFVFGFQGKAGILIVQVY